jgi:hypothetical protein
MSWDKTNITQSSLRYEVKGVYLEVKTATIYELGQNNDIN